MNIENPGFDTQPDNKEPEEIDLTDATQITNESGEVEFVNPEDIKKQAEKLAERLREKTLVEKYIDERQTEGKKTEYAGEERTKESRTRGKKVSFGKSAVWTGKEYRGEMTRYDRGQILKAYQILKQEASEAEKNSKEQAIKKGLLKELRAKAKEMERDMDDIEEQMEQSVINVDVETDFGKFSMPVTVLDLKKNVESGEEDTRVPYVFWGGIRSTAQQNGGAVMALALAGHKVYVMTHLEQDSVGKPDDFAKIYRKEGSFKPQAQINKKALEKLGIEKCNMVGFSTGASIALEAAQEYSNDPEAKDLINDLIAIEPLGIEEKGVMQLGVEFGLQEGLKNIMLYAEGRIKVMKQGEKSNHDDMMLNWETLLLLTKKMFDAKTISNIKVKGSFQIWSGTESPLTNMALTEEVLKNAQELMQSKNPDATLPQLNKVIGGIHSLLNMNPLALAYEFGRDTSKEESGKTRQLDKKRLVNSVAERMLQEIAQ